VIHDDAPGALPAILAALARDGATLRTLSTVRRHEDTGSGPTVETEIEVEGVDEATLDAAIGGAAAVRERRPTRTMDRIFGKRIIVVGGGAQVAQVALGAVSEADRHNLRGERISVDTIALVGEANIAGAVRAVADLPRARCLVLAGSIMGGDISRAADELRAVGIPIIALNMVGSITEHVDLVVSDPVQAGTMAVMAVADTATFDLARQRGRRY
jgi:energy-converting hydrogenase B subunit Q